jgi:cytochrome P450
MANSDLSLQGCPIPEGSRVMLSYYLTHRDEGSREHAEQFNPERFDRKVHHKQLPFSYLPFGGGPRNCIGAAFAQIEARLVLARIIQNFDLELISQGIRSHMGATLEPRSKLLIRVSRRDIPHENE